MTTIRNIKRNIKNVYGPAALRPDIYPDSKTLQANTDLLTNVTVFDGEVAVEQFTLPPRAGIAELKALGVQFVPITKGTLRVRTMRADFTTWPKQWHVKW